MVNVVNIEKGLKESRDGTGGDEKGRVCDDDGDGDGDAGSGGKIYCAVIRYNMSGENRAMVKQRVGEVGS